MNKHIFYEESGQFKVAAVVQENEATYLVDTQHGKRAKIKGNHVFLAFDGDGAAFLQAAETIAAQIDVDLLWSACGEAEITAAEAAKEYFGNDASQTELAAILMALYAAPMYFYKKNKGVFKAAAEDTLKQALAAVARKRAQEAQMAAWADELAAGVLPEAIARDAALILHTPDKQSLTYKAVRQAADRQKTSIFALLQQVGGVPALPQYFLDDFLLKNFPKGTGWGNYPPAPTLDLPPADAAVRAFSIDDLSTTEVDDALSVQQLPNGYHMVGVHIAAPSLAIAAESVMETLVLGRQSTVYYPGGKITMLPDDWVAAFSLDEGGSRPAVSLYVEVDNDFQVVNTSSRIEAVFVDANLRIQNIEAAFKPAEARSDAESFPHQTQMNWLYDFAVARQKQRDRYDPTRARQFDYGIELGDNDQVRISVRERGAPIDMVVSEMMILANDIWAGMLEEAGMPALFRAQSTGKVRMVTRAEPHQGLGLQHYAWFTSPLRRAVDYINQKQLVSLLDAAIAPRFAPQDAMLFAALRNFESVHSIYADFQRQMEAYWSLIYIQQQNLHELNALLLKDDLVRIEGLPLVARVTGIPIDVPPKSHIKLAVSSVDLPNVNLSLRYLTTVVA